MLEESDCNETDELLVELLAEGRVTPQYAADAIGVSRTYASERLKRLVEHGHVERLTTGLYELVDDPRGDWPDPREGESDGRAELEARLEELRKENHDLRNEVMKKEMRLEQSADVDVQAVRDRLEELEAALEADDREAAREALDRLRDELDGA